MPDGLQELLDEAKISQPAVAAELARIGAELRALRDLFEPVVREIMAEIEREKA